ncbi:MAG TPA: hypothetical protein VGU63_08505 [Candidatus Acidoferrales bacterium]|nr:hypothetical protein [Candidatus Acidoferrales bacterium]
MPARWERTTDDDSFRFFSPEEVDEILREGARRGREGSHAAIDRILKHETGLQRAELWHRIRRLKNSPRQPRLFRSVWSTDDEGILREGYHAGWQRKREAVNQLLKRHPDWRPHVIWKHAAKLELVLKASNRGKERARSPWSEDDDRILFDLAGYKSARVIAKMLHRSEAAVRYRLILFGKSSRVHREGFARSALAADLHLASSTIQRLIVQGLLEVRDPRITRASLDGLHKSGRLVAAESNTAPTSGCPAKESGETRTVATDGDRSTRVLVERSAAPVKPSRAKRVWAEVATSLRVPVGTVEKFIARGVLKLYDPRITEKSLRNFCRRHGSMINCDFLNRETREWIQSAMDFLPQADQPAALRLAPLRKHARVVRRCKCGREIRGNSYFRHIRKCRPARQESQV